MNIGNLVGLLTSRARTRWKRGKTQERGIFLSGRELCTPEYLRARRNIKEDTEEEEENKKEGTGEDEEYVNNKTI